MKQMRRFLSMFNVPLTSSTVMRYDAYMLNNEDSYTGTKRLAGDLGKEWLGVVKACLEATGRFHGEFAGAWVWQDMKEKMGGENERPFPNLKPLVSYGILQKTGSSRGGRRAYYVMPDKEGVERALRELEAMK
ncbi:MAG: hypothetical protein M1153_01975 [Patescibacteria group bacterium]|nr:hypothetical protein [Patescibacteria group bacterium]